MKVLVVVGAKKNGNTDQLVAQFVQGAVSAGHHVDYENLFTKRDLHGCIDCQKCKKTGGQCIWQDDLTGLLEKLIEADVLVLASPVYFFSISAQLKMFMDRTYAVIEKIKKKRVFFLATAEGPANVYAEDFKKVIVPIQGYLNCFEDMKLEKMIYSFEMGKFAVRETEAFQEALSAGAGL